MTCDLSRPVAQRQGASPPANRWRNRTSSSARWLLPAPRRTTPTASLRRATPTGSVRRLPATPSSPRVRSASAATALWRPGPVRGTGPESIWRTGSESLRRTIPESLRRPASRAAPGSTAISTATAAPVRCAAPATIWRGTARGPLPPRAIRPAATSIRAAAGPGVSRLPPSSNGALPPHPSFPGLWPPADHPVER